MMRQLLWLLAAILTGCTGGAVVFAPTPLPPEATPLRYEHPSEAFSLLLPPNWAIYEQSSGIVASTSFTAPAGESPTVHISVINLGQMIEAAELGNLMTDYQTVYRPDVARYSEQNRQAMGDGSWRLTGLRSTMSGQPEQINTFIQRGGTLLAIIEVIVPADAQSSTQVQSIINTFVLNAEAELPVSSLSALSTAALTPLELVNVFTWSTSTGVFFVTGEIQNHGTEAVAGVPVRATLLTQDGSGVTEALDTIMSYVVEAGGFAPFGLRFGQGQPLNATQYAVAIGGQDWQADTAFEIVSSGDLVWSDATQYTADGALFVTGIISNTGLNDVRNLRAIATIFDERGRVIGAGFSDVDAPVLSAGDEADYTILISELGGIPEQYVVDVQAIPCDGRC